MKGMLLAAGLSTRLGPLSRERPKPLLPLLDVPVIRYGLALLRSAGIREVCVNLHHLGESIRAELGDEVIYSEEGEILGTGGGVKRMARLLGGERFVVINAKVAIDLDLGAVIAEHGRRGAEASMVVRPDDDARRWGAIDVAEDGRVRGMLGEGETMFTGIHVLERTFIDRIPGGPCDIIRTAYAARVAPGAPVFAHVMPGTAFFCENSTPARYLDATLALLDGAWRPSGWPATGVDTTARIEPGAMLGPSVQVGPGARIGAGARVVRSVVGRGASVEPGADVTDAVLWPGVSVSGTVQRCIITPSARLDVP